MSDLHSTNPENEPPHPKDTTKSRLNLNVSELQSSTAKKIAIATFENVIRGHTESTLIELGVADPTVADYLSEMQIRNIRHDVLYGQRNMASITTGVRLLDSAKKQIEEERTIKICQRLGDSTLLISAIYPSSIEPDGVDSLYEYRFIGKSAYEKAHEAGSQVGCNDSEIFEFLHKNFDLMCYALSETNNRIKAA